MAPSATEPQVSNGTPSVKWKQPPAPPNMNGGGLTNGFDRPQPSPSVEGTDSEAEADPGSAGIRHASSHRIKNFERHQQDAGGPQSRIHANIRSYTDDKRLNDFPRISKPVELMRNSYDCVVIGSGYGGAVAASRMARAGKSVCVLELGQERWPGEYPTKAGDALGQVHWSGDFAPRWLPSVMVNGGNATGMYHMIFGKGQNAIVCNGLGGTSLMNANVYLEADKDTLAMKCWPEEIRNNPECLDEYYDRAKKVLEPHKYPDDWPKLPKLELLKKQAEALGMSEKFKRVPQTTRFWNGPNSCGVEMSPSALTGQDPTGVNDGSKTTTLVTYLADAWNWGAEMFCECEVRHIEKAKDREGYIIYFAWHGRNRGHFKTNIHGDLMWIHAKKAVFLGAGAIGSTEILLRSKEMGMRMSNAVGKNMSGNGDMFAFGYNTDYEVNAMGRPYPSPYHPIGPCINGMIDNRSGHENPLDGYVIEEGTVPQALASFLQAMLDIMPGSIDPVGENIIQRTQARLAKYGSRFLGPYFRPGAVEKTQVYLVMSHDSNQAVLTLKDDKPMLEFLGVGRSDHVKELNDVLQKATQAVGGTLVQNPFYALMGQQVTVHPIGGACMAKDGTGATGATNHAGEVFSGRGAETHEGLIVTDAALIPAALGVNPFATITALAERSVDLYAKKMGWTVSTEKNKILDLFGEPMNTPSRRMQREMEAAEARIDVTELEETHSIKKAVDLMHQAVSMQAGGFGFTEVMSGFVHHDEDMDGDNRSTYELAYRTAKSLCESARFFLSVQSFNTKTFVKHPGHKGMLTGTFVCPAVQGSPFMVRRGGFHLFILDHKAPGTRNLTYDFDMRGINNEVLHFHGYKVVDSSVALSPMQFWRSTSTLYVTITRPPAGASEDEEDEDAWRRGKVVAKGIMHINPGDFSSQVLTMSPTGSSLFSKLRSAASFMTYFTRKSLSLFLAPITPIQYPSHTYDGYVNERRPDQSYKIYSSDNICTRMHMFEPTKEAEAAGIETRNLFMVPGASVDHQIFALPTIPFNAVNYFTRAGYRVFISVHRIGQVMAAHNRWTTFDARLDIKACLEYIREHYGPDKIYTVAHCMGSVALSAGMLDGTIPSEWIAGVTASQVFMNPIWYTGNLLKIMASPVPLDRLYSFFGGPWFSFSTSRDDSFVQRAINQLLRFYPDWRAELCNNAACHRTSLALGRCWNHRNLNEATHRQIDRFFGGVSMTLLHLLMRQGYEGTVMTNMPLCEPLTTPANVQRLRGVPFLLFVGRDNAVLDPVSTERTYEVLCDTFGSQGSAANGGAEYRRRVVPGYGHLDCWMGRNAWKDVYPFVREEVDRVVRGESYHFVEPDDVFKRKIDSGQLLY